MKIIDDLFVDLEVFRNKEELKEYYDSIAQKVNDDLTLTELSRLKRGRFKELREEFYPLVLFSQSKYYPENSKSRIVLGNQGYDAIICCEDNKELKLEFTQFIEGRKDYYDAKDLNEIGHTRLHGTLGYNLETKANSDLNSNIMNAIKKSDKDYEGVELVIIVDVYYSHTFFEIDSSKYIEDMLAILSRLEFKCNSLYLIVKGTAHSDCNEFIHRIW